MLWKHSDYLPVSQPEPVGGSVVGYTVTSGVLSLRAVDAASGRTLWTRPATRSGTTIGVYTSVAVSPGTAYYYKPIGPLDDEKATLVAVDVRTGKDKWVQPGNRIYLGMPSACYLDRPLICALADEGDVFDLRIDGVTGEVMRIPAVSGRYIGYELFNSSDRSQERIERVDTFTGQRLWTLDLRTLSPGRPISTDRGWSWRLISGVYVGWIAFDTNDPDGAPHVFDLSKQMTFGIRASDGKVLWRAAGMPDCLDLDVGRAIRYRCVGTGTATYPADGGAPAHSPADITLQRFDVRTGKTLWSRHVGDVPAAVGAEPAASAAGMTVTIALASGESRTLDMITGIAANPPAAAVLSELAQVGWCRQNGSWRSASPGVQRRRAVVRPAAVRTGAAMHRRREAGCRNAGDAGRTGCRGRRIGAGAVVEGRLARHLAQALARLRRP